MTGRGLLAAARFGTCRHLAERLELFRRELASLPAGHFVPYPDRALHDDGWSFCPLLLRWEQVPESLPVARNQLACPESSRLLAAMPNVLVASFSRMLPGTSIVLHADRPAEGVLRYHVCLGGGQGATMTVDGVTVALRDCRGFVFDHSLPHTAQHCGDRPRDALFVDFRVSDDEANALRRRRGGVNLGPTAAAVAAVRPGTP
jgi:ornithine lipid ester-linked acyl 2-hydroxylase